MTEQKWSREHGWTGDLNDDCFLERYGMTAHVEKMWRDNWWFTVSIRNPGKPPPFFVDLYNSTERYMRGHLTSGAIARRAAEEVMECLREHKLNCWPISAPIKNPEVT